MPGEAHRLRKLSNKRFTKKTAKSTKPQIDEYIDMAKVSVFFIGELQVVGPDKIGIIVTIKATAKNMEQMFMILHSKQNSDAVVLIPI
ncbi:MAG: DNA/RNA helicase domain-containing protein [Ferroplasma sp.]